MIAEEGRRHSEKCMMESQSALITALEWPQCWAVAESSEPLLMGRSDGSVAIAHLSSSIKIEELPQCSQPNGMYCIQL